MTPVYHNSWSPQKLVKVLFFNSQQKCSPRKRFPLYCIIFNHNKKKARGEKDQESQKSQDGKAGQEEEEDPEVTTNYSIKN